MVIAPRTAGTAPTVHSAFDLWLADNIGMIRNSVEKGHNLSHLSQLARKAWASVPSNERCQYEENATSDVVPDDQDDLKDGQDWSTNDPWAEQAVDVDVDVGLVDVAC